jgi:predicted enzyme related to lactoylglutathione lyase
MIQGLRTVIYPIDDLPKGEEWYSKVLGVEPYFDQPFYVGYSVGGFELGLIPDGVPGKQGSLVYWGVRDASAELARLSDLKGEVHEPAKDVGVGIKVASSNLDSDVQRSAAHRFYLRHGFDIGSDHFSVTDGG